MDVKAGEIARQENCFAICVSRCFNSSKGLQICGRKCEDFRSETLCKTDSCWRRCNDLLSEDDLKEDLSQLIILSAGYSNIDLSWSTDVNDTIFAVQFRRKSDDYWCAFFSIECLLHPADQLLAESAFLHNFSMNRADICEELEFRVSAISSTNGFGWFSDPYSIPVPEPNILPDLKLLNLHYRPVPFRDPSSNSNGTLTITLGYNITAWPLGDKDLDVIPLFHVVKCATTYDSIIPNPIFVSVEYLLSYKGDTPGTIEAQASADFMYHKCTVFYFISEVHSKQCNRSFKPDKLNAPGNMHPLEISCETVSNAGCNNNMSPKHPHPECGFSSNFGYKILSEDSIDWSNPSSNISINITFDPLPRKNAPKPLYHVAFYGEASQFLNPQEASSVYRRDSHSRSFSRGSLLEELLAGVNITKINGNVSNCERLASSGQCVKKHDNSFVLTDLSLDKLYGIVICGVLDPKNLSFPNFIGSPQGIAPRAEKIYIRSESHKTSTSAWVYALVGSIVFCVILVLIAGFIFYIREKRYEHQKLKLQEEHSRKEQDNRYIDLPKMHDVWELERRNLIIYDDKKLGSGMLFNEKYFVAISNFQELFLGKLIGEAKGSKDAQSTLGVNLMRANDCSVAVKMLPQYADELCKSEFLREIALMKTLGYHERLVNMLACITDSEPYCLVVEYCSDGDLLHFLRDRCKYMLDLDAKQINYSDPDCDDEFDPEMIMTVKQLLMFAVQISFGLEYLSQKGFVHRDVAARNVLVHDKHYAKIGDFGLCRFIYADEGNYKSRGGRLPVKWMAPESIRGYEFTTKSDVWSFGVCLFEIITLGGCPYPGVQINDILRHLDSGNRMEQPDNCPDDFYSIMKNCWNSAPERRPTFFDIRKKLALQLEAITDEYSYLKLDAQKEYYLLSGSTDRSNVSSSQLSQQTERTSLQPALSDESVPDSAAALIRPIE
ncbi:putative tyrosine-protein kinase F09A5.2 [Aphelenchoides bicaudatus]|nr:putative tyrosine-protein kinase F09A5.2 [Aphelenchoides bicaudatus]